MWLVLQEDKEPKRRGGDNVITYPSHYRRQEEEQASPVSFHVRLGEFYADGEYTNSEYYTGDFECDLVDCVAGAISPTPGVKDVCAIGT